MKIGSTDITAAYLGSTSLQKVYVGSTEVWSSYSYLLDTYTGAAAAYSLRQLRSAYTGSAIKVRRASDNTEQDIGFSNNVLDTTTLASFCSGTDGFVTTWYDQSGNGNNATQTTAANQPQIVSSGSVITENTMPAVQFDGSNDKIATSLTIANATASTSFCVVAADSVSPNKRIYNHIGTSTNERNSSFVSSQFNIFDGSNGLSVGSASTGTQYLITSRFADNDATIHVDGILQGTSTAMVAKAVTDLNIGNQSSFYFDGNLQELLIYASDQSSNRTGIETNMNDFYSIY